MTRWCYANRLLFCNESTDVKFSACAKRAKILLTQSLALDKEDKFSGEIHISDLLFVLEPTQGIIAPHSEWRLL
jgi:hypothetical protein